MRRLLSSTVYTGSLVRRLCYRSFSEFSVLNQLVANQQQQLTTEHTNRLQEFQSQMLKVYLFDELTRKLNKQAARKLASMGLTHNKPLSGVLEFFEKKCRRGFDDTLLATLVQRLGQSMKSMRLDSELNNGHEKELADIYAHSLFQSFIDEVHYGLKKGVYMSYKNIGAVMKGLGDMGYVDSELLEAAINKIERKLNEQDNTLQITQGYGHNPQINRKYYYFGGDSFDSGELLKNPLFNNVVEMLLKKEAATDAKKKDEQALKAQLKQTFGEEAELLTQELEQLTAEISRTKENIGKYTQAVLAIRNRYYQMCKAQSQIRMALADPNLNLELMELEESLLKLKVINIDEVKNLELLADPKHNLQETIRIVERNFGEASAGSLKFIEALLSGNKKPAQPENNFDEQELIDLLDCIVKLAEYADLPCKEVKSLGLTQTKWAKQIIEHNEHIRDPKKIRLQADRIFKNRYTILIRHFFRIAPRISQLVAEHGVKLKIFWSHALIKLGLHEEAFRTMPRLTKEMLPETLRHLYVLVETLNNLNGRVEIESSQDALLERLMKLAESGQLYEAKLNREDLYSEPLGLLQLSTIANWLSNTNLEKHPLFVSIATQLKSRIQHVRVPQFVQNYSYAADIVRSIDPTLELPVIDPSVDPYSFRTVYFNPILETIHKAFAKYLELPEILMSQVSLPLGFTHLSKTSSTFLYLLPQTFTSIEGKFIDGNIIAHLNRIKRKGLVEVETLPIMSFLSYRVAEGEVQLKDKDTLEPFFKSILKIEDGELYALVSKLTAGLAEIASTQQLSWKNDKIIRKVSRTLQLLLRFNKLERTTSYHEIALLNRANIVEGLSELVREVSLLDESIIRHLEDKVIRQPVDRFIKNLQTVLSKELQAASKANTQNTGPALSFHGKRQTIDMVETEEHPEKQHLANIELIDTEFFEDELYNQYSDWQQAISKRYGEINCSDVEVESSSILTKLVLGNHPPKKFSVTPSGQPRKLLTTGYPLGWEQMYMMEDSRSQQTLDVQRISRQTVDTTSQAEQMVALQSLKYELKSAGVDAVFSLLNGFDFIDVLLNRILQKSTATIDNDVQLLPRAPENYFKYLRSKSMSVVDRSPYLSYIFSKIQQQDKLKQLFDQLARIKLENRVLILHNKLTYEEHLSQRQKIEEEILKELENFQQELIEDKVIVGASPSLRMYKTEIDQDDLKRFLSCIKTYSLEEDEDVILSNGNLEKALKMKREKSEHKLIQARILHRVISNQQLSQQEQEYALRWARNDLSLRSAFTNLTLRKISAKDKAHLQKYCKVIDQTALSDLVLELALFFDDAVVANVFESLRKQTNAPVEQTIKQAFEELGHRKSNRQFLNRLESAKFDKESKLTSSDIDNLLSVSKMLKTETPSLRRDYQAVYKEAHSQLEALNESPQRTTAITAWYQAKETEFDGGYYPQEFVERKEVDASKAWKDFAGKAYEEVDGQELSGLVNKLCERMYLLRKHQPPFFKLLLLKMLTHPQLRTTDRNNLLGTLELMKVEINLDSHDILTLTQAAANKQELTSQEPIGKWINRQTSYLPA